MDQAYKLLKKQPVVLEDPFPQGKNETSSDSKNVGGTRTIAYVDYVLMNLI